MKRWGGGLDGGSVIEFCTTSKEDGFLREEDVMFLLDLSDAYFKFPFIQILYHISEWPCMVVYQFKAFCIDLSTAPKVFTKVFSLVLEWAHRQGIRLLRYLDNWLVITDTVRCLLEHHELLLNLCKGLAIVSIGRNQTSSQLTRLSISRC